MKDFTLSCYQELLDALQERAYSFQTFSQFLERPAKRVIMLRHDVDDRKEHALQFAQIQANRGIFGTYFFRIVPQSFDPDIIRAIENLGHEIGYHYEDMDFSRGDPHLALQYFEKNLKKLREIADISTICMHGSPRSRYDNKDVWKTYDYRDYGILGEPYFDIDFSRVFYLTDTGRRWDGHKVSVRDKVEDHFGLSFRHTHELIGGIRQKSFPERVMINFHPQRWTDQPALWYREKYLQMIKNWIKFGLVQWRRTATSS